MDWSFLSDPARSPTRQTLAEMEMLATAQYKNAEIMKTMQEMSELGEASLMLKGVPPAENLQQAADNMLRLSNEATAKGKLNLSKTFLKQAGDITAQVALIGERRAKEKYETSKAVSEEMKQAGSEASAILSFAGKDPQRGQYAWNMHLIRLQAEGEDISKYPTSFIEAAPVLQLMTQRGLTADQAADNVRGLEMLAQTERRDKVNAKLAQQKGAYFEAMTNKAKKQAELLGKQGGGKTDKTLTEKDLAILRNKFQTEFPLGMPGVKYKPGQQFSNRLGETFTVLQGGKVKKIGEPPEWWGKSAPPPVSSASVDTAIPDEALEED